MVNLISPVSFDVLCYFQNRKSTLNAIDTLQICNAGLVILGVFAVTTLDLLDCFSLEYYKSVLVCFSVSGKKRFTPYL